MTLIPSYLKDLTTNKIELLIEVILTEFEYLNIQKHNIRSELELWKSKWINRGRYLN